MSLIERVPLFKRRIVPYILLALITLPCLGFIQFSSSRLQQDDYYHIRAASLLRQQGIVREFPWAKHTLLNRRFADLYFLYHALLIPFTFGNLLVTSKAAAVLLAAASVLLFYWFLERHGIRYPLFWSLVFLLGSSAFLTRLLALRPISLSIIFYILATHVLLEKRYLWLIPIGYAFALSYTAFPLLFLPVLVYTASALAVDRKLELRPAAYCLIGLAAGVVINPYFPNNLRALYVQIVEKSLLDPATVVNLEWMPLSSWALFLSTWGTLLVFSSVLLLSLKRKTAHSFPTLFLFAQSLIFLLVYLKVSRGVDQFVPFATLACAYAFGSLEIPLKRVFLISALALLLLMGGINLTLTARNVTSLDAQDNAGSAVWLEENTPEGSEVFLTNYGSFTELFFYNRHNVYTLGFDPIFLKAYDEKLFKLYRDAIWLRRDPYPVIKGDFGASYVHIENIPQSVDFYRYLERAPRQFLKVYQDDFSAVFKVN